MKYSSILFVLVVLIASGTAYAQTGSKLSGTSYTMLVGYTVDNIEEEMFDKIAFSNNTITSEFFGKKGYTNGTYIEKTNDETSNFEATLTNATGGQAIFTGSVSEGGIYGTVVITDLQGKEGEMFFRGMTTAIWNATTKTGINALD